MVESQDSLYNLDSQEYNLEQIPTEELLSSPENVIVEELLLNFSPNSLSQGFHPNPENVNKMYSFNCAPAVVAYPDLSHLDKLPIVDELHTDYNFNVELNAEGAGKTSWMYSPKLKKVFVKINTHLNVYLKYNKLHENQDLFVRAMIVYMSANDLAEPVKKCPNHRDQSTLSNPEHILRCATDQALYSGYDSGKLFKDRLSVVIPMCAIASNEPLKLQFTCQNSCSGGMNRKATSIIFTLESNHGEILGRKIMNFKVCSCPKRDKDKDEEGIQKAMPKKRKAEQTAPSTSKKVATTMTIVKQEQQDYSAISVQSDMSLTSFPSDLQSLNSGLLGYKSEPSCEVHITMPNAEMAKEVLKFAFDKIAGEIIRTNDNTYQQHLNNIMKQLVKRDKVFSTNAFESQALACCASTQASPRRV